MLIYPEASGPEGERMFSFRSLGAEQSENTLVHPVALPEPEPVETERSSSLCGREINEGWRGRFSSSLTISE